MGISFLSWLAPARALKSVTPAVATADADSEAGGASSLMRRGGYSGRDVAQLSPSSSTRTTGPRGVPPVDPKTLSATAVKDAVVVGAGPTGLLAALELLQNGANVTIIEQRDAYTRPIHWNVRAEILHRFAETCPQILPAVLERLGKIESAEVIDATITDIAPDKLEELRKANPGREVTVGPGGLKLQQAGQGIPTPDAQMARFGGRSMLASPSVGQILTVDLENILFRELHRLSQTPQGDRAKVTIMRGYRCEETESADKPGWTACTAYEVQEVRQPDGRSKFEPTGKRTNLGTPDLVVNCDGANSMMREAAHIARTFVSDGAPYIAGSIVGATKTEHAPNGGLIRRRYAEVTNPATGGIHGLRQIVVGNTKADQTWLLVEVPPFVSVDTKEKANAYYREQAAIVLEKSPHELEVADVQWGPNAFVMQQYISATAVKGANMIFAGDAVGNGHFMTSGGVMTAAVPHMFALEKLLGNLADGLPREQALKRYDKWTQAGTLAWLELGAKEFGRQISVGNFGEEFSEALRKARERLGKQSSEGSAGNGKHAENTGNASDTSPLSGDGKWSRPTDRVA